MWSPCVVHFVIYYSKASSDQSLHSKCTGFFDWRRGREIGISYPRIDKAFHTGIKVRALVSDDEYDEVLVRLTSNAFNFLT